MADNGIMEDVRTRWNALGEDTLDKLRFSFFTGNRRKTLAVVEVVTAWLNMADELYEMLRKSREECAYHKEKSQERARKIFLLENELFMQKNDKNLYRKNRPLNDRIHHARRKRAI